MLQAQFRLMRLPGFGRLVLLMFTLILIGGCGGGTMGSQTGSGIERKLSGFVRSQDGDAIENAEVTVLNSLMIVQTSTGLEGDFELVAEFATDDNELELVIQKQEGNQNFSSTAVLANIPESAKSLNAIIAVDPTMIDGRATVLDVVFDDTSSSDSKLVVENGENDSEDNSDSVSQQHDSTQEDSTEADAPDETSPQDPNDSLLPPAPNETPPVLPPNDCTNCDLSDLEPDPPSDTADLGDPGSDTDKGSNQAILG